MPRGITWGEVKKLPRVFHVLFWLGFTNLPVLGAVIIAIPHWAAAVPDSVHVYPLKLRSLGTYYVHSWLGCYVTASIPVCVVLMLIVLVAERIYRDRMHRSL